MLQGVQEFFYTQKMQNFKNFYYNITKTIEFGILIYLTDSVVLLAF